MKQLAAAIAMVAAVASAQNYRCDWSVVGIGGGEMSSSAYNCGATAGQTAAGLITGSNYWALIGFWQTEGQTGVREQAYSPGQGPLVTRLEPIAPNPCPGRAQMRYSLAQAGPVSLTMHDLCGRLVRVLVNSEQKAGRYNVRWDGCDRSGRSLANGVYFCRFAAGETHVTDKLILAR